MDAMTNKGTTVGSRRKNVNWYRCAKRAQDMLLSFAALLVLCPMFLLIALVIVIDSPGAGPFFIQTRVGKDGEEFRLYKFRTMRPNAESELEKLLPQNEMDGPVFKLKDDPRITRAGRFLRRSGLDELPQLWNVLRGEMSIVGPRPGLPREAAQYDGFARQRLAVQPGLTCYWQIQPNRNALDFTSWMALDVQYVREMDLPTDWKIILATFGAMLRMDGQ